jgi:hypothetical protein
MTDAQRQAFAYAMNQMYDPNGNTNARGAVAALDAVGQSWVPEIAAQRAAAMDLLSKQTIDPFDSMIKEASLAQIRRQAGSSRKASFVTGPRGLEGPMANQIFGGGTSLLGS